MKKVAALTREHWQGQWADGFHLYNDKMPIVATTLDLLREHGPAGSAFWLRPRRPTEHLGGDRQPAPGRRARPPRRRRAAPPRTGSR
ncbi:hypothetical protein [Streptomyces djakartensis]|uniref:hypothetical protein n=1 Tax=Streptomyces djakartensis TaxID=68193 RepID=UPI001E65DE5A|nr:hypothetical protein [Streptomyces djakartensis]